MFREALEIKCGDNRLQEIAGYTLEELSLRVANPPYKVGDKIIVEYGEKEVEREIAKVESIDADSWLLTLVKDATFAYDIPDGFVAVIETVYVEREEKREVDDEC